MTIDFSYPFLEDGLQFLRDKEAVSGKEFANLSQVQKLRVVGSSTIASAGQAAELRSMLAESHAAGEDERQFRERIADKVELLKSDANRILRTSSKQAYIEGMTKTLEKPHIVDAFPYVLYVATRDGRTRPEHAALDGKIAKVGSKEYDHFREELAFYNCRCSLIPLTAKQAKDRGFSVAD
jgi:SPP1 gp7 family putative phage head morphogenesis protein